MDDQEKANRAEHYTLITNGKDQYKKTSDYNRKTGKTQLAKNIYIEGKEKQKYQRHELSRRKNCMNHDL